MKSNILKYSFAAIIALGIASCSSDDDGFVDNEKPTIQIKEPLNEAHLHVGETINVDALLGDNVALSTYKIDIHFAGDGHTHEHKAATTDWAYNVVETIEGDNVKSYQVTKTIEIPDGITSGAYHFGILAIDKSGNEQQSYIELDIVDHDHDH